MKAVITKVHPLKESRNRNSYIRIEFELEDGKWAKTDVCPDFRNFARWKGILAIGVNVSVGGLVIRNKSEVNADSPVYQLKEPMKRAEKLV